MGGQGEKRRGEVEDGRVKERKRRCTEEGRKGKT